MMTMMTLAGLPENPNYEFWTECINAATGHFGGGVVLCCVVSNVSPLVISVQALLRRKP